MSNDVTINIVATEAKMVAEGESDLIERVRKCMRASHNHWMATNEEDQFKGAVMAAILLSEGEERERLEQSVRMLRALSGMTSGVPVDIEQLAAEHEASNLEPVPLTKLWHETKEE